VTDVATASEVMVREMCVAADAADGQRFASYFSPDATFRFGNGDVLVGRPAIAASTEGTVDAIWPMRHRVEQVAEIGNQLFCRFTIVVTPTAGVELDLPCVTVIELSDGFITDYRVHMDITPALRGASTN
jgi:uncharacterized protein (TIGR02246 family)